MKITCPHCHSTIILDKDSDDIMRQIRDHAFNEELEKRLNYEIRNHDEIYKNKLALELNKKDSIHIEQQNKLQAIVSELKNKLMIAEEQNNQKDKQIELAIKNKELECNNNFIKKEKELNENLTELKHKLANQEELAKINTDKLIEIERKKYEIILKQTQEELNYYKDFKSKLNIKLLGESLEQHCLIEFNKYRNYFANHNIYFEKDNDISEGSKADFIYREFDANGVEIISIIFEMKNQADESKNTKTNESFLAKLNKDRNNKKCEYAILVSLLEPENELYNNGIVDMSYLYEKMFVIRPQFFMPLISILRNSALVSLSAKQELIEQKNRHIDITNFEEDLNNFKKSFSYNYEQASKRFETAIDEIDKTIEHLQKVKNALLSCGNQLRLANDKADKLTIKKLTRNNPTMKKIFANHNSHEDE